MKKTNSKMVLPVTDRAAKSMMSSVVRNLKILLNGSEACDSQCIDYRGGGDAAMLEGKRSKLK